LRVLIIEDDAMNIELFQAALEDEHDVVIETDGAAGESRARRDVFDLILLDVRLPKRDGIEVCRSLRSAGIRTPIVAVSASVLPDEIGRATAAGFDDFWSKPITHTQLRAAVRKLSIAPPTGTHGGA
jgi:CheY-like chemotaxis protein